ncbi:MAG: hypothetical protein EOM45_12785 [Clostridia bacterium]|nr:hypothetical protein [Clostridia bacterium]
MKKKFVLTLALVLMVAASLMAATPIEVSGTFKTGYKFAFNPNAVTQVEDDTEAKIATTVAFTGDFWKVTLNDGEDVLFNSEYKIDAKADIYLDKALAAEGMDMGDIALTLHVGTGVGASAPTVLADKNEFRKKDASKLEMKTPGDNFGITLGYSTLFKVYASVDPTNTAAMPIVAGVTLDPIEGVTATVGFTNDYTAASNNGIVVSAKADVAKLVDLDFALAVTGELIYDLDASKSVITADAATTIEGIGLWVAYFKNAANVNALAAKASYETKVEDITVSASFKAVMTDLSNISGTDSYTIGAGAKYAMGGVNYALDAEYVVGGAFSLSPSLSIAF